MIEKSETETWFVHARLDEEVGTLVLADIPSKDHDIVADCWDGGKTDHEVAVRRARLIAAAPELLAVAKLCAELAEHWGEQGPLVTAARAAIAKALVSEPSPIMSDEQMAEFLGFGDDPRRFEAVQKLSPEQRALFERMSSLDTEVELWRAGLGPKPEGVLMDFPRGKKEARP